MLLSLMGWMLRLSGPEGRDAESGSLFHALSDQCIPVPQLGEYNTGWATHELQLPRFLVKGVN
jgi:hypothetical protein